MTRMFPLVCGAICGRISSSSEGRGSVRRRWGQRGAGASLPTRSMAGWTGGWGNRRATVDGDKLGGRLFGGGGNNRDNTMIVLAVLRIHSCRLLWLRVVAMWARPMCLSCRGYLRSNSTVGNKCRMGDRPSCLQCLFTRSRRQVDLPERIADEFRIGVMDAKGQEGHQGIARVACHPAGGVDANRKAVAGKAGVETHFKIAFIVTVCDPIRLFQVFSQSCLNLLLPSSHRGKNFGPARFPSVHLHHGRPFTVW